MIRSIQGYTLLEALLAIAFAGFFFVGAFGLLLTAHRTTAESMVRQEALWKAQQGIGALETIGFEELALTEVGSLSFVSSQWSLGSSGPEDLGDGMTRVVRVQAVERDSACEIIASGGEVDSDSLFLESEVSWSDLRGNPQTILLRTLRTNWANPGGSCFVPGGDCGQLEWDVLGASWFGGKQLREIYITNNTGEEKEVDKMILTWDNGAQIQQIFFDSDKFWSSSGPGTPSGTQVSGTVLDGEDGDIANGDTIEMGKTQFDSAMDGTTITVTYECTDGSSITFGPFTPTY